MAEPQGAEREFLDALARDRTAEGREALTTTLTDVFLARGEVLSDRERALMSEILEHLIAEVETSVRAALAQKLAERSDAPHALVFALAKDKIEVAQPLLTSSTVLSDPELVEIVRYRTLEHQLAIALRKEISEELSDALVASDNVDVVTTLLRNQGARISSTTLAYLAEQSRRVDSYQEPLLLRPDLDPALAQRMVLWVSAALRDQIVARFPTVDTTLLDTSIEATVATMAPEAAGPDGSASDLADCLSEHGILSVKLALDALREGEVPLFNSLFARLTDLPLPIVKRMVFDPSGESLCLACRASNIDKSTFATIFLLTRKIPGGGRMLPLSSMAQILERYDTIRTEDAALVLDGWRHAALKRAAPAGECGPALASDPDTAVA